MPRRVAEALAKRHVEAVSGREEVVALLWLAAKRTEALKPLKECLKVWKN